MIDFPEEIYRNAMEFTAKYTRGSWIKVPFNHFCNDGDGDVMILDALGCHFSATPKLLQHGRSTGGVSGLRKNCLGFRASGLLHWCHAWNSVLKVYESVKDLRLSHSLTHFHFSNPKMDCFQNVIDDLSLSVFRRPAFLRIRRCLDKLRTCSTHLGSSQKLESLSILLFGMRFFSLFSMAIKSGIFEWNSPCGGWWWVIVHSASMYTPICACARVRSVCVCVCQDFYLHMFTLHTRGIIIYYIYVCVCVCGCVLLFIIYLLLYLFVYLSIYFCVCTHSRPFGSRTFFTHISPSHHHFRLLALLCPQRWT